MEIKNNNMNEILESNINIIAENTKLNGDIILSDITRIYGKIKGDIKCKKGSTLILCESSFIEGNIKAETIIIDGYVHGNIEAKVMAKLKGNAKIVGNISSPNLQINHGAFLEGHTFMKKDTRPLTTKNAIPLMES